MPVDNPRGNDGSQVLHRHLRVPWRHGAPRTHGLHHVGATGFGTDNQQAILFKQSAGRSLARTLP
ncbi:MAG: hypothetical protein A3F78_16270 [Burkholderiales bacterium RIFCSPLOWO2_12_FULL_61_40]|nr:MAG: hypothetical protein A3F78_16270 [Burkholderiales bacterium RIFCSPLOWO2_12_FULL_61_40]